jgi:hypothetical protein
MKTYELINNLVTTLAVHYKCTGCNAEINESICPKGIRIIDSEIICSNDFLTENYYDYGEIECQNCGRAYQYCIEGNILWFDDVDADYEMGFVENIDEDLLSKIVENIFCRSRNAIYKMPFDGWHRDDGTKEIDTHKPNSSQAIVLDVWGCIMESQYKDLIINILFDLDEKDWKIDFEYVDEDNVTHLNETYYFDKTKNELIDARTRIDVLLTSANIIILTESKFIESNDDNCSQCYKNCSGNYMVEPCFYQKRTASCAFSGKTLYRKPNPIKYWDYIPLIYSLDKGKNYKPCPFYDQYQIMRNMCLGKALEKKTRKETVNHFVYIDSPKCYIAQKIQCKNYKQKITKDLIDKDRLIFHSYQEIINDIKNKIKAINKNEYKVWVELEEWINHKIYLL